MVTGESVSGNGTNPPPPEERWPLRIGEAAERLGLESFVLRFWETAFPQLVPLRTPKGQRLYGPEHVALIERIRHLVHERGFTLEGARRVLAEPEEAPATRPDAAPPLALPPDPEPEPTPQGRPAPGVYREAVWLTMPGVAAPAQRPREPEPTEAPAAEAVTPGASHSALRDVRDELVALQRLLRRANPQDWS